MGERQELPFKRIRLEAAKVVERALVSLGHATYKLGKGGIHANTPAPWTGMMECDCSGFALWCAGIDRYQPGKVVGGITDWIDTTAVYTDARKEQELFELVGAGEAKPGDLIVYPDAFSPALKRTLQGHIGVVTGVGKDGEPAKVVHCAKGNVKAFGYAIAETAATPFLLRKAAVVRPKPLPADDEAQTAPDAAGKGKRVVDRACC